MTKKRILLKLGSNTLTKETNHISRGKIEDIGMQIAASNPRWVRRDEVPEDVIASESDIARNKAIADGKPEGVLDRIVNGSLEKFYKMNCLMEQEYVKDDSKTIETYTKEAIADIGENISIRRFARFEMGEGLEKKNEDFAEEVMKQMQK